MLLLSALVVLSVSTSNAATITASKPDQFGREYVDIRGPILPGDDMAFDSLVGYHPDPNRVIVRLASPGGEFNAGMNIASSIHEKHLATFVPGNSGCASMCAIMWVSGSSRAAELGSMIGFHNMYSGATKQAAAVPNAILGSYLGKLGFSYKAISWMTTKPANDINLLDQSTARQFGINIVSAEELPKPV
jgi:hypothetical protein